MKRLQRGGRYRRGAQFGRLYDIAPNLGVSTISLLHSCVFFIMYSKKENMKPLKSLFIIAAFAVMFGVPQVNAQVIIDVESGIVSSGYNDVRIPGDQGTLFSLKDDLKPDAKVFYRIKAGFALKKHNFLLLYAPLSIEAKGAADKTILFAGENFPANTPLEATYRFNSYRFTYRYDFIDRERFELGLGFTAKIRDAEISLESDQQTGKKTNVGFVPIVNFRLHWLMTEHLGLLLDGDALAAKQGRAEDVLLALTWKLSPAFTFKAGYRILEGGADNDEVYNFTLLNYGVAGLVIKF